MAPGVTANCVVLPCDGSVQGVCLVPAGITMESF